MRNDVYTTKAPKPLGPYSQAVQAGKFLFISGQLPIDPKEGKIITLTIKLQTRQVMENIKAILEAADYTFGNVVQATVYLTSMALFDEFNKEYARYFSDEFPARVALGAELKAGALVEISIVAYKD